MSKTSWISSVRLALAEAAPDDEDRQSKDNSTDGDNTTESEEEIDDSNKPVHGENLETVSAPAATASASIDPDNATGAEPGRTKDAPRIEVKLRFRNETFYDDYLHRGDCELGPGGLLCDTPLRNMSLYDYAMFVRIVEGSPDNLAPNQYAFSAHHDKYDTYVQVFKGGSWGPQASVSLSFFFPLWGVPSFFPVKAEA